MNLHLLSYALPFNLVLPDGRAFFFQESGQLIAIQPRTKHGARFFAYEKEHKDWINRGPQVTGRINDVQGQPGEVYWGYTIDEPYSDFRGGIVEQIDYSVLDLVFEGDKDDPTAYEAWATPIVERFVDSYRIVTNRGWLGEYARPQEPSIILGGTAQAGAYTFVDGNLQATFNVHKHIGRVIHPALSGKNLAAPSDAEIGALELRLRSGAAPTIYELIKMEAEVRAVRHQDFDLAIVHIETAVEVFVQQLLLDYCRRNQIRTLPGSRGAPVDYQEAIETGNIQRDLFKFINKLKNMDVKNSVEYPDWRRDVYDKRNAVVHRGARGSTESDAKKAASAASAFVEYLRNLLA